MSGTAADAARRRILLVAPQPFFRATGTPINVLMMARALTESGFDIDLLTLPHGEDVCLPGLSLHRVARLPGIADLPVGFSGAKMVYDLLLAGAEVRLLATRRFAVVHGIEEAAFYAVPLARLFGVPAIVDLDSDLCQQLREQRSVVGRALARPAGWLRRRALRHAAGALTVARHLTAVVEVESPHTPVFEIKDIPIDDAVRPPDPARVAAVRAALGLAARRPLVYTGNYDRRQGLVELVRAMPAVLQKHPNAILIVVGGEPQQVRHLQTVVGELCLESAIRLIGQRPPETMAEHMGLAEVLVSPRLEPFATPLKIFSYMASGRPIVATDLPTHTEILGPDAAILVPPTSEGLAAGIVRALDDPDRAAELGACAKCLVEERYTFALFKEKVARAYQTILDGAHERH